MRKISSAQENFLSSNWLNRDAENLADIRPYWELLPEPLAEAMGNTLARISNSNLICFFCLAGIAVLAAGVSAIFKGFINPASGLIIVLVGLSLALGSAFFIKWRACRY